MADVKEPITRIFANQTFKGYQIKQLIHNQTELDPSVMKLFHGGVELNNESSLADLAIISDSTLVLKMCKPKGFKSDSMVLLADRSKVKIG